jgi:hypothetical protein
MLMVRETRKVEACRAGSGAGRRAYVALLTLGVVLAWPGAAFAYLGPGAGISMLGALWAVIAAILFALAGLIWWPIRALRRRRKQAAAGAAAADGHAADD